MKRALPALLLLLATPLGCRSGEGPPPEPSPAPEAAAVPGSSTESTVALTVTTRVLNLREEASARSVALAQLKKGEKVLLVEERGGWVRVKLNDSRIGWVDARYVRRGAEPCLGDRRLAVLSEPPFRMRADGPHGRVVVEGDIGTDGSVKRTRVVSNSSGNAEVAAQAESELKQMKFVAPVKNCRVQPFTYTYARNF